MSAPRLLDLYCCAGGAGAGYARAGFEVIGVDIAPQPNYPFEHYQGDALDMLPEMVERYQPAAIHASPPCQAYTPLNSYNHKTYPDLIAPTREALLNTGKPYVIENVEAARPELKDPALLCGPMFGLPMYRHRLFETNWSLTVPDHPAHVARCARNGYLPTPERPYMTITGGKHSRAWQRAAADVMGMPWARTIREVCEAIPPAYTRHIGWRLLLALERAA